MSHQDHKKPTVLVSGATGAQGGSVVNHLLKDDTFNVRAVTRNTESDAAKELSKKGVEVVKGDLVDKSSIVSALKGASSAFLVTNWWANFGKTELEEGKNFVDAAVEVKLPYFVWSSLENVEKETKGEIKVPHFDVKGQISEYARENKLNFSEVKLSFYSENFLSMMRPKFQNGTLTLVLPFTTTIDFFSVHDLGGVVLPLLKNPKEYIGKSYGLASDTLTGQEITKIFKDSIGLDVYVYQPSTKEFASYGFPGADELANMFEFYNVFAGKLRSEKETRSLYSETKSFSDFLKNNKEVFTSIKNE